MSKNMKLLGIASLTVLIVLLSAGVVSAKGSQNSSSYNGITISVAADVVEGQLTLSGINETGKELKLMVQKDENGSQARWYDVFGNYGISENVIFEDGAGKYYIYAMIREDSSEYSYGPSLYVENIGQSNNQMVIAEATDNLIQYTSSGKDIDSADDEIIELCKKITENKKTEREKISAIYAWVAENITYDFDKYNNMLEGNYSDDFGSLSALKTKKGVCYDFSTLMAALCRAEGIQAKVDKGYSRNIIGYHAWNEIYDTENNEWIILDTTVESLKYHKSYGAIEFTVRSADDYYKIEEM